MLPPIDDSVLNSNPKFAALHASLTKTILTPSGSTKHLPAHKERDAVSEALKAARTRVAASQFLRIALGNLDLSPPTSKPSSKIQTNQPLPTELLELILLLSARLSSSSPLPSSSTKLLESTNQWISLPTHLPAIGSLISTYLHNQALSLTRIASPTTNSSYLHRGIPKLANTVRETQASIALQKSSLQAKRTTLVSKSTTLLSVYHVAISMVIGILEQSKHGAVSRHVKTKTEYLKLSAKQVELEIREKRLRGEKIVYTDEVKQALANYMRHLRDGKERLRERRLDAERVLWGYGVGRRETEENGKEKVMREIARVYGELIQEVREVKRDVERLKGR